MTNLTEQWKKGELPEGDYYIKRRNGDTLYDNIDSSGVWRNSIDEDIIEVLAKVPSYDLWKAVYEHRNALFVENAKLKGLLKECREYVAEWYADRKDVPFRTDEPRECVAKIDELLGEDNAG